MHRIADIEPNPLRRLADYFGAHRVPDRVSQERDRALQRGVIGLLTAGVWTFQYLGGRHSHAQLWFVLFYGLVVPTLAFAYRRFLVSSPNGGVAFQYGFLILDPILIMTVLVRDPQTFAFLNPFMLVVIVRNGIRYGTRTMYLAWGVTLATSTLLATSQYWRTELELTFAFLLILTFVPVFFASLIRRIHRMREIEEERARSVGLHELAVSRSAFLAKVSHELRSPLQGIVSALDVIELRHFRAFEGDEDLLARMRRSSMLLNAQLRDLLTLAKGEAGRLEMHPEPFEACALVEAMAESTRDTATAKGLQLVMDLPPGPLFVTSDGARIDQVLTNLVANSIRYTDIGQVRVSLRGQGNPISSLRFAISDTGPGIPEALLPTLFAPDKFVDSPARRGEGSGIGLAVVRTLVNHLGGKLEVKSRIGEGTTFIVEIPVESVEAEDHDYADSSTHGRILIVDDRSDVLEALESVVDELGYEFDRAGSAATASRLLAERQYDAVLLDLDMPAKGGAELVAEIRHGNGPNRFARFVCMSAAGEPAEMNPHFDVRLAKPIEQAALRKALLGATLESRPMQAGLWPLPP